MQGGSKYHDKLRLFDEKWFNALNSPGDVGMCDTDLALFLSFFQDFCNHFFRLFDKEGKGYLVQEEWIATLKENTR